MKGKAGRVFRLTPKGKKAFEVWSKHVEQITQELTENQQVKSNLANGEKYE